MAVRSGAYANALALALTGQPGAPNWASLHRIGLLSAGCDEAVLEHTDASAQYLGASWGITELGTAHGYTAGGLAVSTPSLSVETGDVVRYSSAAATWTTTDSTGITAAGAMIWSDAATKWMLMQLMFGGNWTAYGGGTFEIDVDAAGLFWVALKV